tara:strand:+ start:1000 stop:1671 length:672 start_codon:yes stop_codon:yes gene_type:complete
MPKGYVLDAAGIQKLRDDHEQLKRQVHSLSQKITSTAGYGMRSNVAYARVTELIRPSTQNGSAFHGSPPYGWVGGGKARIYGISRELPDTGVNQSDRRFELTTPEIDVYNTSRVSIPVGAQIIISRDFKSGLWMADNVETAIGKTTSTGIPARSGTAAGNGLVTFYYLNVPDAGIAAGTLTDAGFADYNVWNLSASPIAASTFVTLKRISFANQWIVDAEDCG